MEIQAAILLVIVFFLMLAFSVPVSYSIIVSALVTIVAFLTPGFGVFVSAQKMVSGIDSFSLIAVPFFILAGLLMNSGWYCQEIDQSRTVGSWKSTGIFGTDKHCGKCDVRFNFRFRYCSGNCNRRSYASAGKRAKV